MTRRTMTLAAFAIALGLSGLVATPAEAAGPTKAAASANCEAAARAVDVGAWFCDGRTLWPATRGNARSVDVATRTFTASYRGPSVVESADASAQARGVVPFGGHAGGYDCANSTKFCENRRSAYAYTMSTSPFYGTASHGTIGEFQEYLKINMNGRQANWNPFSYSVDSGPDLMGTMTVRCRQQRPLYPDSDCGDFTGGSAIYVNYWSSGMVYGNKLNNNSSQYFADLDFSFKALGWSNPSTADGAWYPPEISSHYWTCSGTECDFPAS